GEHDAADEEREECQKREHASLRKGDTKEPAVCCRFSLLPPRTGEKVPQADEGAARASLRTRPLTRRSAPPSPRKRGEGITVACKPPRSSSRMKRAPVRARPAADRSARPRYPRTCPRRSSRC